MYIKHICSIYYKGIIWVLQIFNCAFFFFLIINQLTSLSICTFLHNNPIFVLNIGPPTITVQSSRYSTIYGKTVVLKCTVHSAVALRAVYWKVFYDHDKDSPRFIHEGDLFTAGITIDNPSLSLQSK